MTLLGHIVEVLRYPVKSMRGENLAVAEVDRRGLVGDRLWALRDEAGKFGSGKTTRRFRRIDGLLGFSAVYDGHVPVVEFLDGTVMRGDDGSIHDALSETLGAQVELAAEAAISHFDAGAVHLCTTGSLSHIGTLAGHGEVDARRFRPNLLIDSPGAAGFVEDGWLGWRLRVGDTVELVVTGRTERCAMVTYPQDDLPPDPRALRVLADRNRACLGVYVDVVRTGWVRSGDEVYRLGGSEDQEL